jgi:hypothetical protein
MTNQPPIPKNEHADVIQHLIDAKKLEGPARGVALRVLSRGVESLSAKQRFIYKESVEHPYLYPECKRCGTILPASEVVAALKAADDLCANCRSVEELAARLPSFGGEGLAV